MKAERHLLLLLLFTLLLAAAAPASALASYGTPPARDYVVVGGGYAGLFQGRQPGFFSAEFRFKENYHGLHPLVIAGGSSDVRYVGVGVAYDVDLSRRWRVTLSSGPGYYDTDVPAFELGHSLEFFSNIELSADVGRGRRIGLSFGHLSNASLGDRNPGTETLRLTFAVPLRRGPY